MTSAATRSELTDLKPIAEARVLLGRAAPLACEDIERIADGLAPVEFGADATAVALTYGAQAGVSTKGASASAGDTKGTGMWKRGMAVFTLAKGGLMYEASIGGQKFNFKPLKN